MMALLSHRSLSTGTAAAVTVGLGACGSSPETKQSTSTPASSEQPKESTISTSLTPEVSPRPSLSPSQNASPEALKPNTSHNSAATECACPSEKVQAWMRDPSSAPGKVVFLAFDDGPDRTNSAQILDALKVGRVHGTFFVVENLVSSAPEALKRKIAEGHSVTMHSYAHNCNKLYPGRAGSLETIKDGYNKTRAALEEVLGADFKANTWRYPGGYVGWRKLETADEALAAEGVHWINQNYLTGDAEPENRQPKDVAGMVRMTTSTIGEGLKVAVTLAHNAEGKDTAVRAMSQIISAYKKADYKFGIIAWFPVGSTRWTLRTSSLSLQTNTMTGELILFRHGESGWDTENLFIGWVDVDINEKDEAEAWKATKLLTSEGLLPTILHTSLLRRAIHTTYLALDGCDRHWIPVRCSWRLNERHYGMLQGLDKTTTRDKYSDEQSMLQRRSYDTPPPVQDTDAECSQFNDPRYADVPVNERPRTEYLKDVVARMLPYWKESIIPDLDVDHTILVTIHGNSLRTLVKYLDDISDEDIAGLNTPTGTPLLYRLDENHRPLVRSGRYLDPEVAATSIEAVKNQGKKQSR